VHIIDGATYLTSGDYEQAIERLLKANAVMPENSTVNSTLGFEGAESDRLTGLEVTELLWGRRFEGSQNQENMAYDFRETITTDAAITDENQYLRPTSTASVEKDMLCTKFADLFSGRERCVPIYRNPRGTAAMNNEHVGLSAYAVMYFSVME